MKRGSFTFVLVYMSLLVNAQFFQKVPDSLINFPSSNNSYGSICWGDYDNDNDLDFVLIGGTSNSTKTELYENIGNNNFIIKNYNLNHINNDGIVSFGDIDNDGDLDLFLSGSSQQGNYSAIYINTLPDSLGFVLLSDTNFYISQYSYSSARWADFDNDGDLDIYASGGIANTPYSESVIYYNLGDTSGLSKQNLYQSIYEDNISINDLNNDGYLDIFSSNHNRYYNNGINKNPKFSVSSLPFFSLCFGGNSSSSAIDLNNDGQFDFTTYLRTTSNDSCSLKFFKTMFNGYSNLIIPYGIPLNSQNGKTQTNADLNNDGLLDIVISSSQETTIFYQDSAFFYSTDSTNIFNINPTFISISDFDNDGDLDLFLSGSTNTWPGYITALYRNDSTPPNTPPTAPQSLWTTMDSTKVIFNWQRATDIETPQITLSYNLMVGTSSKAIDITSPMADTVTGFRRVVELGNAQLNNFYILDKSIFNIGDTVYWSVQTIDNGFGYSPFSQEGSAIIYGRMEAPVFDTICGNDSILWRSNYYNTTGRYKDSYGLDSAFFLDLKVHPAYLDQQTADICSGSSYTWNGNTYYNSGTYNIQHYTTKGCDSIERLVLNVHPGLTVLQNKDLCMGDSVLFGGKYLKSSGIYWDSLQSVYNCDSIIQLTLNVAPSDTTVWQSGDTLFATPQNASFRWWNCDNQQFIYAANQSFYVPNQNGHYAVEISSNGCSYLTSCMEVTGLAIAQSENNNLNIRIMPNPNKGVFFLELEAQGIQEYQIQIFDALGKEIYKQNIEFEGYKKLKIDLDNQASGVYQLRVVSEHNTTTHRFIIR